MMGEKITSRGRTGRRRIAALVLVGAVLAACAPSGPTASDNATLRYVKQTVFGQQASDDANLIGVGAKQPVLDFTVEDTPPSIFVNWVVPDGQAADFACRRRPAARASRWPRCASSTATRSRGTG